MLLCSVRGEKLSAIRSSRCLSWFACFFGTFNCSVSSIYAQSVIMVVCRSQPHLERTNSVISNLVKHEKLLHRYVRLCKIHHPYICIFYSCSHDCHVTCRRQSIRQCGTTTVPYLPLLERDYVSYVHLQQYL